MTDRHRTYEVLGILMKFHAFPADVQGKYCLVEAVVPPGCGAPPNHHAGETEAFHILEGTFEFMVDGKVFEAKAGDHVRVPDGAVHAFSATGDTPGRVLILNAPGEMHDTFFTGLGVEVPDDTTMPQPMDGPPDVARVVAMAEKVGMKVVAPAGA
ncbi:cupin [Oceanicola sp. 22II-s10i]|uniref:cupin domain-containing protein n=1 Tax=Oceanicola sp. 22II-s10i TaxID=1317116 RepID=UPI000B646643|nr:cupin domain-containing protein [Oceanicola sp. 22II-s10i]OWU83426.1 cupin [Oceanicola sp. 22II-s10i]